MYNDVLNVCLVDNAKDSIGYGFTTSCKYQVNADNREAESG